MSKIVLLVCLFSLFLTGCATHRHIVGDGSQTGVTKSERQWYALYGLVPLGEVDTKDMSGGAEDYEIKTEESVEDFLLNLVTGMMTIVSRTVTVAK